MGRRGTRQRIGTGIYRDATGVAIVAHVNGMRQEQRLPLNTTLVAAINARRTLLRSLEDVTPAKGTRGSLREAVTDYLDKLPEGRAKEDREDLLTPWVEALGDQPFAFLTRPEIMDCLMRWQHDGLSATTRNHRLSALRVLWRTVTTDPGTPHPCETIPRSPAPKAQRNHARRLDLIALVLEHVATECHHGDDKVSHAAVKLALLAWTGHPPATLARIRPEHVRWQTDPPEVYLQPRRKGEGMDAAWVPLLPEGALALKRWLALGAWGQPWHIGTLRIAWRRAIKRAQAELHTAAKKAKKKAERARLLHDADALTGMRLYDLRHSLLTAMGDAPGATLHGVSAYAQHSDIRTTMIYVRGANQTQMRASVSALSATVPRFGATRNSGKARILAMLPRVGAGSGRAKTSR